MSTRHVCTLCGVQFVPRDWREECIECRVAMQQAQDEGMLARHACHATLADSTGPKDAPMPSAADLASHANGHVEYGEASCLTDDEYE